MLDDIRDPSLLPSDAIGVGAKHAAIVAETRAAVTSLLAEAETLVIPHAAPRLAELRQAQETFRARVALIGQVKAGKTALTNALIAEQGLLPSDVNPWTSVVTSIHLNAKRPKGKAAVFSFFTSQDWADMVDRGGALGRMISEADTGLDLEEGTLRDQIVEMQARTEARLGHNFPLLLDGSHSFSAVTPQLVERYVCMGDADLDPKAAEGRYADVTRSADLYLDRSDFALPTMLCDTPGVNDPFLVREAATLERVGETDLCVLVLNANQALSTVDVGLMRVLRGLQAGQVVLFVNRIDQLSNPDAQIPRIERALRALLRDMGLDENVAILFGSALWAGRARFGAAAELPPVAEAALTTLRDARQGRTAPQIEIGTPEWNANRAVDLSGLHELSDLIQARSATDIAGPALAETARDARALLQQSAMLLGEQRDGSDPLLRPGIDPAALTAKIDALHPKLDGACQAAMDRIAQRMKVILSGTYYDFVTRESESLTRMIERGGNPGDWTPDSERLRSELCAAYDGFVEVAPDEIRPIFAAGAKRIETLYDLALADTSLALAVAPPAPVKPGAPTSLMKTMTIDLTGSMIGTWLRRKLRPDTFVARFRQIANEAMLETVEEVETIHLAAFEQRIRSQMRSFLAGHVNTLRDIAGQTPGTSTEAARRDATARVARLDEIAEALDAVYKTFGAAAPRDSAKPAEAAQ